MRNLKRLTYLFLFTLCSAFTMVDVGTGSITYEGKVYSNKTLLDNDSIKVVYHYFNKHIKTEDIYVIHTNKSGEYKIVVEWSIQCPSSRFANCKGLSRDSCLHVNSLNWNPDSIGFVYRNKEIKLINPYWQFSKQPNKDQFITHDLIF
jgi:hypothetical protein